MDNDALWIEDFIKEIEASKAPVEEPVEQVEEVSTAPQEPSEPPHGKLFEELELAQLEAERRITAILADMEVDNKTEQQTITEQAELIDYLVKLLNHQLPGFTEKFLSLLEDGMELEAAYEEMVRGKVRETEADFNRSGIGHKRAWMR